MPTVTPEERAFCERLASLSGWDVAKELGLSYSGDSDPIRHGGVFYDPSRWDDWEHAPAVEFWWDDDSDRLMVSPGSINKPDADDMATAFRCCDVPEEAQGNPEAQIEACRGAWGLEPDDYEPTRSYDPDTWAEWRLWRSVLPMLRSIAPTQEDPR